MKTLRSKFLILYLLALPLVASLSHPASAQGKGAFNLRGLYGGLVTAGDFIDMTPELRKAYVSGLSDQIVYLAETDLNRGWSWYVGCVDERGIDAIIAAFIDYIEGQPLSLPEPATRSFLWAMGKFCTTKDS